MILISENQNIEFKQRWHDDYLKWTCGFANAQGGTLYVGKDNEGQAIGLPGYSRLMEEIPNKVKDVLGIVADANLHWTEDKASIEAIVEPYPSPVSYKGQFQYRRGSTKQELKGPALDKFKSQKQGKHYDGAPVLNVSTTDLDPETLAFFRKRALKSKRVADEVLNDPDVLLLENLQLLENGHLKRAAILLFHPKPLKFVTGAYGKIGKSITDHDLRFQNETTGNLFQHVERAIDLLFTKYIKADISYEGIARVETYEYPKEAVREALLNALAHKDYAGAVPVQVSVYDDKIIFWNEGQLHDNYTVEKFLATHPTKPFNPEIANAFFRSGYSELWGRGIIKIVNECLRAGLPIPPMRCDMGGLLVELKKDILKQEQLGPLGLNNHQIKAILFAKAKGSIINKIYQQINAVSKRTATSDLWTLTVHFKLLTKSGTHGAGIYYTLNRANWASTIKQKHHFSQIIELFSILYLYETSFISSNRSLPYGSKLHLFRSCEPRESQKRSFQLP